MQKRIKVLVIRNDHIGDLVYSTGLFREIKQAWPNCEITAIVSKLNRPIIEKNPNINKILELDIPKHNFSTFKDYLKMAQIIRKEKFDYGLDLRGSLMNSFFLLYLGRVKNRISHVEYHPIIKTFLTKPLIFGKQDSIFKDNKDLLQKGLGIKEKNKWPEIITDKDDEKEVNSFLNKNNLKKYICVCPVAGLAYKQWDLKNFKDILIWFNKNYKNHKILLLGIAKDKGIIENLASYAKNSISSYNYNIRQMVLLFNKSQLVIAHDGGPMHSAWLTGSKTLALYPANTNKFIPLKNCKTFISKSELDMKSITLEQVEEAIKKIL